MNETGEPVIHSGMCNGCRRCVRICPIQAIEMYFTPEQQKLLDALTKEAEQAKEGEEADAGAKLAGYRGVWVFVEQERGKPNPVSWELMGTGSALAVSLGVELSAVVIGYGVAHLCRESFHYGATRVYAVDTPLFYHYRTEPYYRALCHLVEKYKPEIVLVGATGLGRDLAGAVATVLRTGLTADCTGLAVDGNRMLQQTRPAFGGNIMATIATERTRPQMATVRPHVMPLPEKDPSRNGVTVPEEVPLREEDIGTKILEVIETGGGDGVDIAGAEIIVSGGRGMRGKENFQMLAELAKELGGVVGASRAAVEAGWMPPERQVGQTGKTVRPRVYIACGISGAIQHLVGMQQSDVIVAINSDRRAPIFGVATYGIVGDVFTVVPALTKLVREARARKTPVGAR
jgi:electron transfer flavoprotein alpha subunit